MLFPSQAATFLQLLGPRRDLGTRSLVYLNLLFTSSTQSPGRLETHGPQPVTAPSDSCWVRSGAGVTE